MDTTYEWIDADKRLPDKGVMVLVWQQIPDPGADIACITDGDIWISHSGQELQPSHWMDLPKPPQAESIPDSEIHGPVIENRFMVNIDEDKETVARLMQHFIDGKAVMINGIMYFVTDMKNEMIEGTMMSVFSLAPAD